MDDPIREHAGKVRLYRRAGLYQACIHLGNGEYIHCNLETANTAEAERLAEDLRNGVRYESKKGLPVRKRTPNAALDEYIRLRDGDKQQGKRAPSAATNDTTDDNPRQMQRVWHFLREYAGNRAIDSVNRADKTLQWEITFIKTGPCYAKDRGHLRIENVPDQTFTVKDKLIRPSAALKDLEKLKAGLEDWLARARGRQQQHSRQPLYDYVLDDYVLVMALSGTRKGEANQLEVRDVQPIKDDKGRENIRLHIRGKTGTRVVAPHLDAKAIIDALLARRGDPDPDAWLFVMKDGTQIDNLRDQFDRVLEEDKLAHHAAGAKNSLDSLRHFHAVAATTRGGDSYTNARTVGNSVQVIEEHRGRNPATTARATAPSGGSGSFRRVGDDFPHTALTGKQTRRLANMLAGYLTWLMAEHDKPLGRNHRRKVIRHLLEREKLAYRPDDIGAIDQEAGAITKPRMTPAMLPKFRRLDRIVLYKSACFSLDGETE